MPEPFDLDDPDDPGWDRTAFPPCRICIYDGVITPPDWICIEGMVHSGQFLRRYYCSAHKPVGTIIAGQEPGLSRIWRDELSGKVKRNRHGALIARTEDGL